MQAWMIGNGIRHIVLYLILWWTIPMNTCFQFPCTQIWAWKRHFVILYLPLKKQQKRLFWSDYVWFKTVMLRDVWNMYSWMKCFCDEVILYSHCNWNSLHGFVWSYWCNLSGLKVWQVKRKQTQMHSFALDHVLLSGQIFTNHVYFECKLVTKKVMKALTRQVVLDLTL